jgi:GTP-binding protein
LAQKPQIVVLNKIDLPDAEEQARLFHAAYSGDAPLMISAKTQRGLDQLLSQILQQMEKLNAEQ